MASNPVEEVNGDSDELQQDSDKTSKKSAKHDSGAADLEKVTDFMEEKEISPTEFFEGVCTVKLYFLKIIICIFALFVILLLLLYFPEHGIFREFKSYMCGTLFFLNLYCLLSDLTSLSQVSHMVLLPYVVIRINFCVQRTLRSWTTLYIVTSVVHHIQMNFLCCLTNV